MIIENGIIVSNNDKSIKHYKAADFDIYYKGFIFVFGNKCNDGSIEKIVTQLRKSNFSNFENIYGNYFFYIFDHKFDKKLAFIDNSGIFKSYIFKDSISTSFLELIDYYKLSIHDIDHEEINEFFHMGCTYWGKTLMKTINFFDRTSFYFFCNNKLNTNSKNILPFNSPASVPMDVFFNNLIYATSDLNISLDLTGGKDSRLIASFFCNSNADFEFAISGLPGNHDISIAQKIAETVKKKIYPTIHSAKNISAEHVHNIFNLTDAQIDVLTYHRSDQMNHDRISRGIDIQISGAGGEIFNDHWWLQDFPFYNKKNTNISKFYNLRIESIEFPHQLLGNKLKNYSLNYRKNNIEKLKPLVLDKNTKSYDSFFYNFRIQAGSGSYVSAVSNYLYSSYTPLIELEMIRLGVGAKRSERFFNRIHRKWITKNSPEISRIRTTENITASSSTFIMFLDIAYFIFNRIKRLTKQILRKILNKTYLQESPTSKEIYTLWKNDPKFLELVNLLIKYDILNFDIKSEKIPDSLVGKITTIGLLIDLLESHNVN